MEMKRPRAVRCDKIYDKVMSVRVVEKDLNELKALLNRKYGGSKDRKYGGRKMFMNSVSWVVRSAMRRRIRELKYYFTSVHS